MALLFFDGFDTVYRQIVTEAQELVLKRWTSGSEFEVISDSSELRKIVPNKSLRLKPHGFIAKAIPESTCVTVGFSIRLEESAFLSASNVIALLFDNNPQFILHKPAYTNNLIGFRKSTVEGVPIYPTNGFHLSDRRTYIEVQIDMAGFYELRVNSDRVLRVNIDTVGYTSTALINNISFGGGLGSTNGFIIDDVYITNTTGSYYPDFLRELSVESFSPNESVVAGWTPSSGAPRYELVSPSIYTEGSVSTVAENTDTYKLDSSAIGTYESMIVHAIKTYCLAKKNDPAYLALQFVYKPNGGSQTLLSDSNFMLKDWYSYIEYIDEKYNGATNWGPTQLTNDSFGFKRRHTGL